MILHFSAKARLYAYNLRAWCGRCWLLISQSTVRCRSNRNSHKYLILYYSLSSSLLYKTDTNFNITELNFNLKKKNFFRSSYKIFLRVTISGAETIKCHHIYHLFCRILNNTYIFLVYELRKCIVAMVTRANIARASTPPAQCHRCASRPNFTTPDLRTTSVVFTSQYCCHEHVTVKSPLVAASAVHVAIKVRKVSAGWVWAAASDVGATRQQCCDSRGRIAKGESRPAPPRRPRRAATTDAVLFFIW